MRVLAGVVLFNPDIKRLKENIDSIILQVERVILVDNGSGNYSDVLEALANYDVVLQANESNLGIATALNQIMNYARSNDFDWVFTLDQDSVSQKGIIERYIQFANLPKAAILTCKIKDRNYTSDDYHSDFGDYCEVNKCITSGSFVSVSAYSYVGGYDEKMFIDLVDFDFCSSVLEKGYKIYKINYCGLLHEIGKGKKVRFWGRNLLVLNHSPFRQYYLARNELYFSRKHPLYSERRLVHDEFTDELKILLFEKYKIKKLVRRWKGIIDYFRM